MTGRADYWKPGTWNAMCSECGRKRKADELVRNWQGLWRCPEHDEPRQTQDFARGIAEHVEVPWAQVPLQTFVGFCTLNGQSGLAGVGVAGCMRAGNTFWDPYGVQTGAQAGVVHAY